MQRPEFYSGQISLMFFPNKLDRAHPIDDILLKSVRQLGEC